MVILAWGAVCALVVFLVVVLAPKQRAKVYVLDSVQVLRAEKDRQEKEKKR